jgi:Flp pilus assembly protein TadG
MGHLNKQRAMQRLSLVKPIRGLAMVEFAISLPFLLLMFAGVGEFGIMFYTQTTLNTSVNDAARFLASDAIEGSGFIVITPQARTRAANLAVYGNIRGDGQPLINGFDTSMVTIDCAYGSTVVATGTQCTNSVAVSSVTPISVKAEIQYSPVFGQMLENLSGTNIDFLLNASAINAVTA